MRVLRLTSATEKKTLGCAKREQPRGRARCRTYCERCASPRRCGAICMDKAAGPPGAQFEQRLGVACGIVRRAQGGLARISCCGGSRGTEYSRRSASPEAARVDDTRGARRARRPARARNRYHRLLSSGRAIFAGFHAADDRDSRARGGCARNRSGKPAAGSRNY